MLSKVLKSLNELSKSSAISWNIDSRFEVSSKIIFILIHISLIY